MDGKDNYDIDEDNDDYSDDDDNNDSPYDDALDEDQGDDADDIIANEMEQMEACRLQEEEDSRYNRYETMCDAAALREVDVLEPINPTTSLGIPRVSKQGKGSRKGRSATKRLKVSGPMHLKFDNHGRPKEDWRLKYGQQAGFCMRKLNINWNWGDVNEGMKKLMWEDTKVKYQSVVHFTNW